ncbi:MAG: TetR/AcrR family transcriptional regulator [Chloroflexi bacterium]|nr:MAG: TetR/AcrR family transcriptional regulator [Chloroflexota bacterium]
MGEVKAARIPLRQRQASETRRGIVRAARRLFAAGGYAATSIDVVAEESGVAARTVYAIFGTKKAILAAICEEWLTEAGVMETVAEGLKERHLRRRLALVAHSSRRQWESERGVRAMLEGAAASDAEVARMLAGWKSDRARSLHGIVAGVEGDLRGGLDGKRAGAIIRALTSAEIYSELVAGEGWSPDEYEEWLGGLLSDLLLSDQA